MDKTFDKYAYEPEAHEAADAQHFVVKTLPPVPEHDEAPASLMRWFGLARRSPKKDAGGEQDALLHASEDDKTEKEIEQRRAERARRAAAEAHLLYLNDAESAHRRKVFALVFVLLAIGLAVPWALAQWVVTIDMIDALWKRNLLTLGVLLAVLTCGVALPYFFTGLLKNKPYVVQIVYMLGCMTLMTVVLAVYVLFVHDPFVNAIILYAACFLAAMALYCITPVGRFHHGAAGLFVILVMSVIFFAVVVYPNMDFTRDYVAHKWRGIPRSAEELEALKIPEPMWLNMVQLLGTLAVLLFLLYRMHLTGEATYAHDPLYLAAQVYVMLLPTLLLFLAPKWTLPGIAWK